MSWKAAVEAVVVVGVFLFATASAVSWKDCGELNRSLLPGLLHGGGSLFYGGCYFQCVFTESNSIFSAVPH